MDGVIANPFLLQALAVVMQNPTDQAKIIHDEFCNVSRILSGPAHVVQDERVMAFRRIFPRRKTAEKIENQYRFIWNCDYVQVKCP